MYDKIALISAVVCFIGAPALMVAIYDHSSLYIKMGLIGLLIAGMAGTMIGAKLNSSRHIQPHQDLADRVIKKHSASTSNEGR